MYHCHYQRAPRFGTLPGIETGGVDEQMLMATTTTGTNGSVAPLECTASLIARTVVAISWAVGGKENRIIYRGNGYEVYTYL